jgi:hypothetical protein
MQCPQCGARTEVNEKRGPFRDRRCTNGACGLDFTTREQVMTERETARLCARTRATNFITSHSPPTAGAEGAPISFHGPRARSGRVGRPRGRQKQQPCALASEGLEAGSNSCPGRGASSDPVDGASTAEQRDRMAI